MEEAPRPLALLGFLCSVLLLIYGLFTAVSTAFFAAGADFAFGEVLRVERWLGIPYTQIEVLDEYGRHQAQLRDNPLAPSRPGQRVRVRFDPRRPNDIRFDTFASVWLESLLLLLAGAAASVWAVMTVDLAALLGRLSAALHRPPALDPPPVSGGRPRPAPPRPAAQPTTAAAAERRLEADPGEQAETQQSVAARLALLADENLFGILQPMVNDPQVSDVVVSRYNRISVRRGNDTTPVEVKFPSQKSYEAYVERLLLAADTTYSLAKPTVDGMIGKNIRIHAVHAVLAEGGPYLTLRISRFASVEPADLIRCGMAPAQVFEYLQRMVVHGHTILVAGEVGSGKTTLARALASCIPAKESILVIEDTPEIKIAHAQVRYVHTREANIEGAGEINSSECIRAGMRMAMSRIIFGEIRDPEAAEAFIDVCVSGHPGLSTIHARSAADVIYRLQLLLARRQAGVNFEAVLGQIATAVQVIAFVNICKKTGQRRIMTVRELHRTPAGVIAEQDIFSYRVLGRSPGWQVLHRESYYGEALLTIDGQRLLADLPAEVTLA